MVSVDDCVNGMHTLKKKVKLVVEFRERVYKYTACFIWQLLMRVFVVRVSRTFVSLRRISVASVVGLDL